MSLSLYAFRDVKSNVLSNHFVTSEPFEKVKQNISVSLLQLSLKDPTNPFVLFSDDYELVFVCNVPDYRDDHTISLSDEHVRCSELLVASRMAFESRSNHTSQNKVLDEPKE